MVQLIIPSYLNLVCGCLRVTRTALLSEHVESKKQAYEEEQRIEVRQVDKDWRGEWWNSIPGGGSERC